MIRKFAELLGRKIFIPKTEVVETKPTPLQTKEEPKPGYIGVPAPVETPTDTWFSEPVKTEKVIAYEKHVAQKIEEQKFIEATQPKKEPKNIHQKMYEIATKSWSTWQENLGGSENFQEGPGGWDSGAGFQSGTGYNQFRG